MNFIKEIFQGDQEQDYIHQKFIRYGRGEFHGPVISLKKSNKDIKVNGTADYVNILSELILRNSDGNIKVSGNIFSKREIKSKLISKTKKKRGLFNSELKGDFVSDELLKLYEEFKDAYFFLDLYSEGGRFKLKTKKKLPKPGSEIDDKFFTAVFDISFLNTVMNEICFDSENKNFKEMKITHTYLINELVIPEEYKNDAVKARIFAKRKGVVKRIVDVDGYASEFKKEFEI